LKEGGGQIGNKKKKKKGRHEGVAVKRGSEVRCDHDKKQQND